MNFPVADTFEPGEPLLRGLDRPFRGARRSNNDGALAATVKPCVPGNFIEETNAVTRHLPPLFIFIEHYRCAAAPSYDPNQLQRARSAVCDGNLALGLLCGSALADLIHISFGHFGSASERQCDCRR